MASASTELTKTTVATEDCVLHVSSFGKGPRLVVLIPGGGGHGDAFHASLPLIASSEPAGTNANADAATEYTVATFDRRGHGLSSVTHSGEPITTYFNPAQAARDIAAIIKHFGFERASVFGTSQGGVIALQFAVQFPELIETLIVHEAPTFALLPRKQAADMLDFIFDVHAIFKRGLPVEAFGKFLSMTKGWDAKGDDGPDGNSIVGGRGGDSGGEGSPVPEGSPPLTPSTLFWFEHEFLTASIYTPNLFELRASLHDGQFKGLTPCSVACVAGKASEDAPYARTTYAQAEILQCRHLVWPGGHLVYLFDPSSFAKAMREALLLLKQ